MNSAERILEARKRRTGQLTSSFVSSNPTASSPATSPATVPATLPATVPASLPATVPASLPATVSASSPGSSPAPLPSSKSLKKGKRKSSSLENPKNLESIVLKESVHSDLIHVVKLIDEMHSKGSKTLKTLVELGITNAREVHEMANDAVVQEIERIIVQIAESIMNSNSFSYSVPTRSSSNQIYIPELDRIVLSEKLSKRPFSNISTVRKTAITTRVLQLIHQVLYKGIHVTKRDLFYTDVKLFVDQGESDSVLDDVACMVGSTRSSLNVVASEKGVVVGRLTFRDDGDLIDCTKMGVGGKAIPPYIDRVSDITSDALFILLVEKDAAFMRLAEDRFYNKYPCVIITGKGQPDVSTRRFLKKIKTELQIPVLGLVDSDPYGLKILSVYMSGSKNMSYDSAGLTTPDIKWLGIRPSDLDKYNIPEQCRLKMKDSDIKTGKDLLEEDFIKKNPDWYAELEIMIKTKEKAEIQALSNFGFQYLTENYLPRKLREGDWL